MRATATAGLFALAVAGGCGRRSTDAPAGPRANPEAPQVRARHHDRVSVQFHVVDERPGTPPLVRLAVDVVMLNHADRPCWVLLPTQAGQRPGAGGGVSDLQVESWGTVTVGAWAGTGGFRAVRLAAGARVELHAVPIAWWRHDDDPRPPFEAAAARELTIDGAPAERWFGRDPLATDGGGGPVVDAQPRVRHRPDQAEVAVELVGEVEVADVPWPRD